VKAEQADSQVDLIIGWPTVEDRTFPIDDGIGQSEATAVEHDHPAKGALPFKEPQEPWIVLE
jgi:hypothetical protein